MKPREVGLSGLNNLTDDYFIIPKSSLNKTLTPHGANLTKQQQHNLSSLLAGEPRAGSQIN